jgi:hypothetical protein
MRLVTETELQHVMEKGTLLTALFEIGCLKIFNKT